MRTALLITLLAARVALAQFDDVAFVASLSGQSTASFSPEQAAGLFFRITESSVSLSGDTPPKIIAWTNTAPEHFGVGTLSNNPAGVGYLTNNAALFNGRDYVYLPGTFLTNNMATISHPFTIFLCGWSRAPWPAVAYMLHGAGTGNGSSFAQSTTPTAFIYSGASLSVGDSLMQGGVKLIELTYADTGEIRSNGVQLVTGDIGSVGLGNLYYGSRNTGGQGASWSGPCMLIYTNDLPEVDRAKVRQWFRDTYNSY